MSVLLLGMAGPLLWYGVCTNRIAANDWEFQIKHASLKAFPEVWLAKGNLAYYGELDAPSAIECLRRAVVLQPLLIDGWMELIKVEVAAGNEAEAGRIYRTLAPLLDQVSTWKWQEILLAYDLRDEEQFAACFNFILTRLPRRIDEAGYLAVRFWGDWRAVVPHVSREARESCLDALMKAHQVDAALSLWQRMQEDSSSIDGELRLRFCHFLIRNDRLGSAREIWRGWKGVDFSGIEDGGFEHKPLGRAFGWYFRQDPEVIVERSSDGPFEGGYCLHVHFRGAENLAFNHVWQVVPVEPGRAYRLSFAERASNLTTDQGVFVQVSGFKCTGLLAQSGVTVGSKPWTKQDLEFSVPDGCEAITVRVVRKESLKFDSKISGDYWLDDLRLE